MQEQLHKLIETIKADYTAWHGKKPKEDDRSEKISKDMIKEFNESIEVHAGKKYIKIIAGRSVWGFIVNVDNDKKFKRGDLLKPAGYNAPARNAARGNIIDGGYTIRWTGPLYL